MSLLLAWSMTVTSFLTTEAQADWYVGAYGGLASPGEFSNATLSSATLGGGVTDARISDLELKNGPVWGAKLEISLRRDPGWHSKQMCTR